MMMMTMLSANEAFVEKTGVNLGDHAFSQALSFDDTKPHYAADIREKFKSFQINKMPQFIFKFLKSFSVIVCSNVWKAVKIFTQGI